MGKNTFILHTGPSSLWFFLKKPSVKRPAWRRWSAGWPSISTMPFIWRENRIESRQLTFYIKSPVGLGHVSVAQCTTYCPVLAVFCKRATGKVQVKKDAAKTPHVYSLREGEAQGDLRCPASGNEKHKSCWYIVQFSM